MSSVTGGFLRRFLGSAISNAAGYGVGGAILPTLEPLTRDLANLTWAQHPVMPLPSGLAAEAYARGHLAEDTARREASFTGHDGNRFEALEKLSQRPPALESLFDLHRRGLITDGVLNRGMRQAGLAEEWRERVFALRRVLPSVTDFVRMAVREVFDPGARAALNLDAELPGTLIERGEMIGLAPETTRDYWAAHWELPSYTQGLAMMFRGEISRDEFNGLLKALDYAPTWRGPLEAIGRAIPTMSDMIRFAVREVYDPAAVSALGLDAEYPAGFTAEAAKHGMVAEDAQKYWRAHWRLPSALQGYRMLWRGEINEAQLDQLLKALDYPPMWRDRLANIARIVPGRIDLKRMLRHEILTPAEVEAGYRRLGYDATDARRMQEIAVAELEGAEAGQPWATRARSRLYTVAHNEFLEGSIDAGQANAILTRVGALPAERSLIVSLWEMEDLATRRELTPTQVYKAYDAGLYTEARAIAALEALEMSEADARTFLASQ